METSLLLLGLPYSMDLALWVAVPAGRRGAGGPALACSDLPIPGCVSP
jgi:hypothetical protein